MTIEEIYENARRKLDKNEITIGEFAEIVGREVHESSVTPTIKKCYNVSDYAECDQFICSRCGIELQDWCRVERDEDGDITYHEYEFRFCPNCGAKL